MSSYAKAVVSIEVALDLPSTWGNDCTVGQVHAQALSEYQTALDSAIKSVNEGHLSGVKMRIVSHPKVTVVIKEKS